MRQWLKKLRTNNIFTETTTHQNKKHHAGLLEAPKALVRQKKLGRTLSRLSAFSSQWQMFVAPYLLQLGMGHAELDWHTQLLYALRRSAACLFCGRSGTHLQFSLIPRKITCK